MLARKNGRSRTVDERKPQHKASSETPNAKTAADDAEHRQKINQHNQKTQNPAASMKARTTGRRRPPTGSATSTPSPEDPTGTTARPA